MIRNIAALIFVVVFSLQSFAISSGEIEASFNENFKEILIDARGSRGGNGDVAAAYLTAMELKRNYEIHGNITILVDQVSSDILDRLTKNNSEFSELITVETMRSLPERKSFDLYMALASPSGFFYNGSDLRERTNERPTLNSVANDLLYKKIKMSETGVLMVQTVLGNTENKNSQNPFAVVRHKGLNYKMLSAGLGANESGIYRDYVALELKDKNPEQIRNYINHHAEGVVDDFTRESILRILNNKKIKGANIGLVYGVTASETHKQFFNYLKGLAGDDKKKSCPNHSVGLYRKSLA